MIHTYLPPSPLPSYLPFIRRAHAPVAYTTSSHACVTARKGGGDGGDVKSGFIHHRSCPAAFRRVSSRDTHGTYARYICGTTVGARASARHAMSGGE